MKVIIALCALVAIAVAAPASPDADAQVLRQELDNIGVDGFRYASETSNGISQQAEGTLINAGSEQAAVAVRGQFQYVGPDGVTYSVSYIADENGFQPSGAHLPVPPQ